VKEMVKKSEDFEKTMRKKEDFKKPKRKAFNI